MLLSTQACKDNSSNPSSQPQIKKVPIPNEKVSKQKLPISNSPLNQEFSDWSSYAELDTAIRNLKNGDPAFFKSPNEDLKQLFLDLKKSVPNTLKTNGILARIKVTETLSYKLNDLYNIENTDSKETDQTKIDLIESHDNLIFQINKTLEKEAQYIQKPIL
jgi:hypothetical protein